MHNLTLLELIIRNVYFFPIHWKILSNNTIGKVYKNH